jgi:hypothetical protein
MGELEDGENERDALVKNKTNLPASGPRAFVEAATVEEEEEEVLTKILIQAGKKYVINKNYKNTHPQVFSQILRSCYTLPGLP